MQSILASRINRLAAGEKESRQTLVVLGREFSSTREAGVRKQASSSDLAALFKAMSR